MRYLSAAVITLLAAMTPIATPAHADPPTAYDSGLSVPFEAPDPAAGRVHSVLDYGATPHNASDDDAVAIQQAISAAAPGDVVYIPNGVYHVESTINLKSGVSVRGQSRDSTVIAGNFCSVVFFLSAPHAVMFAAPGVTNLSLSSFTITYAAGKEYAAGVRLGDVGNIPVSRIAVRDLRVERHKRFGLQLQNATHVLLEGNVIRNASSLGGGGSGYGILIDQSGSHNNWVRENMIGPVIRHGILVQFSAHHNLIEHNQITGAVSGALDLHGEDEYSNEIRYNKITDCVRNGTAVSPNGGGIEVGEYSGIAGTTSMHDNTGPHNWIHHNEVSNCDYGLRITNNSDFTYIEDNIFVGNSVSGIQADLAPLENLTITGNDVSRNGNGIVLYDVKRATVKENYVRDNTKFGIWTDHRVTDYVITGNAVTGNGVNVFLGSRDGIHDVD